MTLDKRKKKATQSSMDWESARFEWAKQQRRPPTCFNVQNTNLHGVALYCPYHPDLCCSHCEMGGLVGQIHQTKISGIESPSSHATGDVSISKSSRMQS